MQTPDVRFMQTEDGPLAYQTVGDGPAEILLFPPVPHSLDLQWEQPRIERFLRRLTSFARVTMFDWVGIADLVNWSLTSEFMLDILRQLLDEIGAERAIPIGMDPPATAAGWFAAAYPDRVSSLVLIDPAARLSRTDDYPHGMPQDVWDRWSTFVADHWGTGDLLAGSRTEPIDEATLRWYARYERATFSPIRCRDFVAGNWMKMDLRGVIGSINCPTLIISHSEHAYIRPAHGRYIAEHIDGSTFFERPGPYGAWWLDDTDFTLDQIESFVTGTQGSTASADRVLAPVLFTDIVGSTVTAAEMGDARWRQVLDLHASIADRQIDRHRGRLIKNTGDGVLATFDGPARAIRCGLEIRDELRAVDVDIRTGVHTGEIERRGDDIGGLAVHVGARVMNRADAGEVFVTSVVKDLVAGSGIDFEDRGFHELKGVPEKMPLFAVAELA